MWTGVASTMPAIHIAGRLYPKNYLSQAEAKQLCFQISDLPLLSNFAEVKVFTQLGIPALQLGINLMTLVWLHFHNSFIKALSIR